MNTITTDKPLYILESPIYVGGYQIGGPLGLQINFKQKPIWLHRFFCKLILGFVWVDITH